MPWKPPSSTSSAAPLSSSGTAVPNLAPYAASRTRAGRSGTVTVSSVVRTGSPRSASARCAQVSALESRVGRPLTPATAEGCQVVTGRFSRPEISSTTAWD